MKGEIARALAPVARRVRLRRLAGGFSRGALAGAACAVLAQLPRLPEQLQTRKEGASWSF